MTSISAAVEPAFERHLTPEPRADQAQVEWAGFRRTRRYDRDGAADERVTTPGPAGSRSTVSRNHGTRSSAR